MFFSFLVVNNGERERFSFFLGMGAVFSFLGVSDEEWVRFSSFLGIINGERERFSLFLE